MKFNQQCLLNNDISLLDILVHSPFYFPIRSSLNFLIIIFRRISALSFSSYVDLARCFLLKVLQKPDLTSFFRSTLLKEFHTIRYTVLLFYNSTGCPKFTYQCIFAHLCSVLEEVAEEEGETS